MAGVLDAQVQAVLDKIAQALQELVHLKVQTVVTALEVKKEDNQPWRVEPKLDTAVGAITIIDMLQGDIRNAVSSEAITNAELMAMHKEQVTLSRQIVADNLKALVDVAKSLTK